MGSRSDLHSLLKSTSGLTTVYFQPPNNLQMTYPCIVYIRDRAITKFACNLPYKNVKGYQITIIDKDPDSEIPDKIAALPMCVFDRFFRSDNLNHFVYNIFF